MTENAREFFENLVDTVDGEVQDMRSQTPTGRSSPQTLSGDEQKSDDRDAQQDSKSRKGRTSRSKREATLQLQPKSDEMLRALAKATVQKTVRFQPKLIADLEALQRKQERMGEIPASFQRVQNEALRLWLDKHAR